MNFRFANSSYSKVALVGLDQLISATSNFLIIWLCLMSFPTDTFGSFSYVWSSIALFIILSRALFGVPALLDSQANSSEAKFDVSASLTGSAIFGVFAGLSTFILYVLGGVNESNPWIFGLFFLCPIILFQDSLRYLMISMSKVKVALALDLFLLICISSFVIYAKRHEFMGIYLVLTVAFAYIVALSIFIAFNPIHLSLSKLEALIRFDFHRRSRLLADATVTWGFGLLTLTLIRVATGDNGMGLYNQIIFLFGPVTLVTVFLTLGLQSEVVRTKDHLAARHKTFLIFISLFPILWFYLITQVPDHLLVNFIGQSTSDVYTNAKPFAIWASLALGIEILILFMRAYGKFSEILILRCIGGIIMLIGFVVLLIAKSNLELFIWVGAASNLIILLMTLGLLRLTIIKIAFTQQ